MTEVITMIILPYSSNKLLSDPSTIKEINRLRNLFILWGYTKGLKWFIKRMKLLRLLTFQYLSGNPIKVIEGGLVGITPEGSPKIFSYFVNSIKERDTSTLRLLLSVLQLGKAADWWGPADFQPITELPRVNLNIPIEEYKKILPELCKRLKIFSIDPKWQKPLLTTKSGPMGIALASAFAEAKIIPEQLKQDIGILGGEDLLKYLCDVSVIPDIYNKGVLRNRKIIRVLSRVYDPEGKVRIVACFDYWSQNALFSLHENIYSLLERLETDCTFDQSSFCSHIPSHGPFHSLDLKACTDRFPALLQKELVSHLLKSSEKAEAWYRILCSHEFYVPWEDRFIKYETGQPMGAYSSFAVMALCHHTIVQWAALKAGFKSTFTDYWILGDDLVILNDSVALHYREIISSIGMEIAEEKSLVSKDTFEFAKRLFHNGIEVSHWPVEALSKSSKKHYVLAAELIPLLNRGYLSSNLTEGLGFCYPLVLWYRSKLPSASQARRIVNKVRGILILSLLKEKAIYASSRPSKRVLTLSLAHLLHIDLGCNREWMLNQFILEVFSVVKATLFRNRIIENAGQVQKFYNELKALSSNETETSQVSTWIDNVPAYRVGRQNVADLQGMLDSVRSLARSSRWEEVLFSTRQAKMIDPCGLSAKRGHIILAGATSKCYNMMKIIYANLERDRRYNLSSLLPSDDGGEGLESNHLYTKRSKE